MVAMTINNNPLRKQIVQMVYNAKDGHIPSAFSIIDILELLYREYLKVDSKKPDWPERDYFILSKGHGCVALYTVLHQFGFLTDQDINLFCKPGGILGEHPDCTKVPGVEASTGSLGHGFPFAVGLALGLRIKNRMTNKVYVLVGDGECHEGTVWEAANDGPLTGRAPRRSARDPRGAKFAANPGWELARCEVGHGCEASVSTAIALSVAHYGTFSSAMTCSMAASQLAT